MEVLWGGEDTVESLKQGRDATVPRWWALHKSLPVGRAVELEEKLVVLPLLLQLPLQLAPVADEVEGKAEAQHAHDKQPHIHLRRQGPGTRELPSRAGVGGGWREGASRGCGLCRAQFQPLPRSQVWEWGEGHRRGEEKQTRSFKRSEGPSFHIPATEFPSCPRPARARPPY